ncbi:MAG TPA: hypothetical protein VFW37_14600 [Alphaproteobacteria bacterium]|nr:hypothetical protein [Alphaproteobacteria bacterium]
MNLVLAPLVPVTILVLLALAAVLLCGYALALRVRGAIWRGMGSVLLLAALANPIIVRETRAPLPDVVALINDQSPSQDFDGRAVQARDAETLLRKTLAALPNLEVRTATHKGSADGTHLFEAAQNLLLDTPPDRVAGIILLSDGQVHDAPDPAALQRLPGPLHVLLTGDPQRADRRLVLEKAPKFGIAGEPVSLTVRFEDQGEKTTGESAQLSARLNGGAPVQTRLTAGQNHVQEFRLEHAGANIIELEIEERPGELSTRNNHIALSINGVRDRMRVLLISGEPNPGERTWRNLLKADPSVDLVHFTILRPPEKQDGTPVDELALISFPTRELFLEKLHEFDLIIFDRYQQRGVLNFTHFDNIAKYVEKGGALLSVSGPDFLAPDSLYRTPLAMIFPGQPTGRILTGGFKPRLTGMGLRHPVTDGLPGANTLADASAEPDWGRWFRVIEAERLSGHSLIAAPGGEPLLIVDKFGEGRVAQILSDHGWLWARGFEGGGPQAELLRRVAHWLMKEPGLEEEDLSAVAANGEITITRRSLSDTISPVQVSYPDGRVLPVTLAETRTGRWQGVIEAREPGIYRLTDGQLTTLAASGQTETVEYSDLVSSDAILRPVSAATGGGIFWLGRDGMPAVRQVKPGRDLAGASWMGLRYNGRYRVLAEQQYPLLPGWLVLALATAILALAWRTEGR